MIIRSKYPKHGRLNTVRSSVVVQISSMDRYALSFAAIPHDCILKVFNQLHTERDSVEQFSTVSEDDYDGGSTETGAIFLTDTLLPRAKANSKIDLPAKKPVIPLTDECSHDKLNLDEFEDPSEQVA